MSDSKKRAIVIGGAGFLGSHVSDVLTQEGYDVVVFDRSESSYLRDGQRMIIGDIMDLDVVAQACEGCEVVYNFAGAADIDIACKNPVQTAELNVLGTVNTLEAAHRAGAKRYVFASSIYVFSDKGSFYKASKQSAECFIEAFHEAYNLDYTILRYGSLYGRRGDNIIYSMLDSALKEKRISYPGTGEEIREYIHVTDAARASWEILGDQYKNQHIILAGNEKMKVKELIQMICEIIGDEIVCEFSDRELESHYDITPYSFNPKVGKKLVNTYHVDMGQGLLDCLSEIHNKLGLN